MIKISPEAKFKIKETLKNNPNKTAKIILTKGGCAGNMLSLILNNENPAEEVVEINGLKLAISNETKNYINNISIEIKNSLGTEIIIRNLNATTCRCGKSFKI